MIDDVFTSIRTAKYYNAGEWTQVGYNSFSTVDLYTWFRQNCTGQLYISPARLYFSHSEMAVLFQLKFAGN